MDGLRSKSILDRYILRNTSSVRQLQMAQGQLFTGVVKMKHTASFSRNVCFKRMYLCSFSFTTQYELWFQYTKKKKKKIDQSLKCVYNWRLFSFFTFLLLFLFFFFFLILFLMNKHLSKEKYRDTCLFHFCITSIKRDS